jgi:hypothetical protein
MSNSEIVLMAMSCSLGEEIARRNRTKRSDEELDEESDEEKSPRRAKKNAPRGARGRMLEQ